MALVYSDAGDIPQATIDDVTAILTAAWKERDPDVNLSQGNFLSLVLHPQALLTAIQESAISNAIAAASLTGIVANPNLADAETVNRVLGNFGLSRISGQASSGQITLVVGSLRSVIVPGKTKFTCGGVDFTTDAVYAARTSAELVSGVNDRLLVAVTGGWAFNVSVTAVSVGAVGNVKQGTSATPAISIPGLVRSHAAADFSGGLDEETNAQLVARQQQGLAAKSWGSPTNIEATTAANFTVVAAAIIGAGQSEMQRDKQAVWPVGTGSRADLWLRTSTACEVAMITKTAVLIAKAGAVGTWQFSLGRDDLPGFYEITKILLETADQTGSGFATTSVVRGTDVGSDLWVPTMPRALDGSFSRYQTAVVQFDDTVTDATSLVNNVSTKTYNIYARKQPKIKEVQEFWASPSRRPPGGDLLVRAAVPCVVTVTATFTYPAGNTVSTSAVKAAIASAVNGDSFTGSLPASLISQAIHTAVPSALAVTSLTMTGRLIKPNGAIVTSSSSTAITIADDFDNMVSGKTTAFFLSTSDITLTATAV